MTDVPVGPPTLLSIREAARRCGLSRTTLARKIKSGEISVRERGEDGTCHIDVSELTRYMDVARVGRVQRPDVPVGPDPGPTVAAQLAVAEARATMLEAQLADLRGVLADMRADREDLRADRDQWRQQATAALRLLPAPTPQPEQRWGWRWWRRRAG